MELTDLVNVNDLKTIVEGIYKFGLTGTIYKKDNFILVKSERSANDLCPIIKSGKDSVIICSSAQQRLAKMAHDSKKPAVDECDAGFVKFVLPIFIRDEFLGTAGGCGCLLDNASVDSFYVARQIGKNEKDVETLSADVCRITSHKLSEVIEYVQENIDRFSEKSAK
jgi:ligand-binding sensor protein